MTRAGGYKPTSRTTNLARATDHAMHRFAEMHGDYYALRQYMKRWLQGTYGLSRTTIADYLVIIEIRVRAANLESRYQLPRQQELV